MSGIARMMRWERKYGNVAGKFGNALEAMTDVQRTDIPQCDRLRVGNSDR
jgi:hypothetical protein